MIQKKEFKYFAFISYKSEDIKEAWRLKKKLEGYGLPTKLQKEYEKDRKPAREVFLDKTNLRARELRQELQDNLDDSHFLIVVCSPRSAQPCYVSDEIAYFTRNGREHEVFAFVIESDPLNFKASCYNPEIVKIEERLSKRDGVKREILAANIEEKGTDEISFLYNWPVIGKYLRRELAYMKLIAGLLDIELNKIWSFQKIRIVERFITWVVGLILVISALTYTWYINQPVEINTRLNEVSVHNDNLPPMKDAVITLQLENETKTDTLRQMDGFVCLPNIPRRYIGKEAHVSFVCRDFLPLDTTLTLSQDVVLNIRRDAAVYGNISFRLWNPNKEELVINTAIEVDGRKVTSDGEGRVTLTIPLAQQKTSYKVTSSGVGISSIIVPPCGPDDVVEVE